jgi:uncharacterized membrane protein AbrB (regulator of aidB expression)
MSLREPARAYVLGITILGAAVALYSIVDLVSHPVGIGWLALVVLTAASGWAMLRIPGMPIGTAIVWGSTGGLTAETTAWKDLGGGMLPLFL